MILTDVVPMEFAKFEVGPFSPDMDMLRDRGKQVSAVAAMAKTPTEMKALASMLARVRGEYQLARADYFQEHLTIPAGHETESTKLRAFLSLPQTALDTLRGIADKLGFLLFPFDYLKPEAWEKDKQWAEINDFRAYAREVCKLEPHVLAPVQYLSLEKLLADDAIRRVYVPPVAQQAFLAIELVAPILQSLRSSLKQVQAQVKKLDASVQALQRQIQNEVRARLKREEAERVRDILIMSDPLLFTLGSRSDINASTERVILGPCWGPDAPDIMFEAVRLAKLPKQREQHKKALKVWGNAEIVRCRGIST